MNFQLFQVPLPFFLPADLLVGHKDSPDFSAFDSKIQSEKRHYNIKE